MRSRILFAHKLLLFCLVTLSLLFCGICFNVADAVSTGAVDFIGSEITPNIPEGTHYQHDGKRKVSNNVEVTAEGDSRRVVLEEKWLPPGKPPDITIFELKVSAKGQGRILLTLNNEGLGGGTSNEDVGSYKGMEDPVALKDKKDFYLRHFVPHENIREYEDGFNFPYDDDCVPVKHKGYDLEVVSGEEKLEAKGKAYAEKISIAFGTEESTQKALGLTAGWNTAAIEAGYVEGTKSSWGWKLVEHPHNTTEPKKIDSSFQVTVNDIISIEEAPPQDPPCEVCDNCGDFVHNKEDHFLGVCPVNPNVAGCGEKRWSCETSEESAWHQIRTCTNKRWGVCGVTFRHCTNGDCNKRPPLQRPNRGHSDGSVSQAPAGVVNPYADSHHAEAPPDDDDDDNEGETVVTPPDDDDDEGETVSTLVGLRPSNGSANPTASPGGTHEAKLVTSKPYYYVRWHIKGPGDRSSLGTLMETDEGWQSGGTETEASFSHTFPDNAAAGVYTITAVSQRYSNLSEGSTRSYTVTVE